MGDVRKVPEPEIPPQSLEKLVKQTHELAKKSENVYWDCPHAQQRMRERNVTIRQILDVLRHGKGVSGPTQDQYGDWRIKLKYLSAGRSVQVVVVVREEYLEVVTVI
jgi:hypothetical protein